MARPQTFSKKENEKKKQARRLEKQNRKEERKLSGNTNSFEDMIAYVDENGRITSTPPETNHKKEEINHEEIVISTPKQESPEVRKGQSILMFRRGMVLLRICQELKNIFFM